MVGCTTTSTSDGEMIGDELDAFELMWADKADGRAMMPLPWRNIGRDRSVLARAGMIGKVFCFGAGGGVIAQHAIHCEAARILSECLGLDAGTCLGVLHKNKRWYGKGTPNSVAGEAIPRPARVMQIGKLAAHCFMEGGIKHGLAVIEKRTGTEFDPALVKIFRSDAQQIFAIPKSANIRDMALAEEPGSPLTISAEAIDNAFAAIADFRISKRFTCWAVPAGSPMS